MPRERTRVSTRPTPHDFEEWTGRDADEFRELEAALAVDANSLDENCIQHSDLFYRVSRGLARYSSRRDELKQACGEIEADVDAEIRENIPEGERMTEAAIASAKKADPRVKRARKELAQLDRVVGQIAALKEAYLQRSYSLKGLIDLHLAGYFGDPSQRSSIRDRQTERANRARTEMHRMRTGG